MATPWSRAILHVDMDAFFASVEQRDDPSLRGKPVIVGGAREGRGVVSAASYEARVYGVHSAMPAATARRLCPRGIFLPVSMERYKEASRAVFAVFERFTPAIEPMSVDEAFLDVTGCQRLLGPPETIARDLQARVRDETDLPASVGVAPNRFVAKIASDLEKPDGLVVIPPEAVLDRLAPLPVRRIWGVGKVLGARLENLGIKTVAELRQWPREVLHAHFGQGGDRLYDLARGEDASPLVPDDPEKSISNEITFSEDVEDMETLRRTLLRLSDKVARRARAKRWEGRTVQLKVRYENFATVTRRTTLPAPIRTGRALFEAAWPLLTDRTDAAVRPVRLLGVGISALHAPGAAQGSLFEQTLPTGQPRDEALETLTDRIRDHLGDDAIGRASTLLDRTDRTASNENTPSEHQC